METPHQPYPLTQEQAQQQQEQQPQQQPQPDVCALCVEDPRMHQIPCPGPRPTFQVACGHHIHLTCLFVYSQLDEMMPQACPVCEVPFFTQEQVEWSMQVVDRYDTDTEAEGEERKTSLETLRTLWSTEPDFRKEVKALKQIQVRFGKSRSLFFKEKRVIQKRFEEQTTPTIAYLKTLQKEYVKEFSNLKSRRASFSLYSLYTRRLREILNKYNLHKMRDLHELCQIPKAPKMSSRWSLHMCRYSRRASYTFRIRI